MMRDGAIATWSDVIHSLDEVRENARQSFTTSFHSFPYCVVSPAFAGNYGRSRSTYLCLGEDKIGVLRADGKIPHTAIMPLSEIDALETGTELLSSWITILFHGQRVSVFFNSVSKPLYAPFIDAYRAAHENHKNHDTASQTENIETYFATLKKEDFKYEASARQALGNRLPSTSFYHPTAEIPRSIFGARVISSYLLIATSGLLCSFSEARIIRYARFANYSMVVRYIPIDTTLTRVQTITKEAYSTQSFSRAKRPLLELPVHAAESEKFSAFCRESNIALSN